MPAFDTYEPDAETQTGSAPWVRALLPVHASIRELQDRIAALEGRAIARVPFSESPLGRHVRSVLCFLAGLGMVVAAGLAILIAHRNGFLDF